MGPPCGRPARRQGREAEDGAIDGIHPRVVVLMIGVNNVVSSPSQSSEDIARGIAAIVVRLREILPKTQILLLGTFPKDRVPDTSDRRKILACDAIVKELDEGKWIRFLDISNKLLEASGDLHADISHAEHAQLVERHTVVGELHVLHGVRPPFTDHARCVPLRSFPPSPNPPATCS